MKLSNIFKSASPFLTNLVTLLLVFTVFLEENQTKIEAILSGGDLKNVTVTNILSVIVFVGGILKAFSSGGGTTETGTPTSLKSVFIKPLVKLLIALTKEEQPTPTPPLAN